MSKLTEKAREWAEEMERTDVVYAVVNTTLPDEDRLKDALFNRSDVLWVRIYQTWNEAQAAADKINNMAPMPFLAVETVFVPEKCRANNWEEIVNNLRAAFESGNMFDRPVVEEPFTR